MNRISVFASGSGSNFQSIINAVERKEIDAEICGLVTNKEDIKAIERAEKAGIPVAVIKPADYPDSDSFSDSLLKQLKQWNPSLIVLAGYLALIPQPVIAAYENRIINIHPSLLPKYGGPGYYGRHVHQAVLDAGETRSGCSVHYVTGQYDEGEVIRQTEVPVLPGDTPETLAERILSEEHKLLPDVINQLLTEIKQ